MKLKCLSLLGFLAAVLLLFGACKHDPVIVDIPDLVLFCDTISPTYTSDIKAIVDASCAYSGCHNQGAHNYDSFAGMLPSLNDGQIRNRVLVMREDTTLGMPPNYAINGVKDLTDAEIALFECWLDDGFPE